MTPSEMLREFHAQLPPHDEKGVRLRLHFEEHGELELALDNPEDRAGLARELADVVYVCFGTALVHGIDLEAALAEVHRANMAKMGAGLDRHGKARKPTGWQAPDMTAAIS